MPPGDVFYIQVCVLLQLILLNETALVLVNNGEGLLELVGGLAVQTTGLEELRVVEWVGAWNQRGLLLESKHCSFWCPQQFYTGSCDFVAVTRGPTFALLQGCSDLSILQYTCEGHCDLQK